MRMRLPERQPPQTMHLSMQGIALSQCHMNGTIQVPAVLHTVQK